MSSEVWFGRLRPEGSSRENAIILSDGATYALSELDQQAQRRHGVNFSDLQITARSGVLFFALEVIYRTTSSFPARKKTYFFSYTERDFGGLRDEIFSQYASAIRLIVINDLQGHHEMQVEEFYRLLEAERTELGQSLETKHKELASKQNELEEVQANFNRLQMEVSRLQSSSSETEADLTEQLQKVLADAVAADLKLKIAQTTNNINSALLNLEKLRDFSEALKHSSTLNILQTEAQKNADMAAALAPGSATVKQARGFLQSVNDQVVETKKQAEATITATDGAKELLEKLKAYVAEFEQLSLATLSAADLTAKQTEIDKAKQCAEQILTAFMETPTKSRVSKTVANNSITTENIGAIAEVIKKQVLNARVAEQAAKTAKEAAERAAAMTKQKYDEAGELYERNSKALDQLFGLPTDSEAAQDPKGSEKTKDPKEDVAESDEELSSRELKKSLKQLFRIQDGDRTAQPEPQSLTETLSEPAVSTPANSVS